MSSSSSRPSEAGGIRASVDVSNVTEVSSALIGQFRNMLDPQLSNQLDDRWCARFLLARPGYIFVNAV